MTTSSDSSVTRKCAECWAYLSPETHTDRASALALHKELRGHEFIPAPAPPTGLASDPLVTLLVDARMTIAMLRSFIDSGESLTLADRGGLIAICDRLQNARDERLGFATGPVPVLSSIEGDALVTKYGVAVPASVMLWIETNVPIGDDRRYWACRMAAHLLEVSR